MAFVPKNICTFNTEQEITAQKTFTQGLLAKSFKFLDGNELKAPAIESMKANQPNQVVVGLGAKGASTTPDIILGSEHIKFGKDTHAPRFIGEFEGDGNSIKNLTAENLKGTIPVEALPLNNNCFEVVEGEIQLALANNSPFKLTSAGLDLNMDNIPRLPSSDQRDSILIYSPEYGLSRVHISSVLAHTNDFNSKLFNFVNDGQNLGNGVSVLKGKKTSGRSQDLQS